MHIPTDGAQRTGHDLLGSRDVPIVIPHVSRKITWHKGTAFL